MKTQALINVLTRLNFYSKINHVPSKLKNTFKVLALAILLTSCEKVENLIPEPIVDTTTQIHIYYDNSIVDISVNGVYYTTPRIGQGVKVIVVDDIKTLSAFNYGKKASLTIYTSTTRMHYGDFRNIFYAP
jgi:photosystem II stability/assembly factor-like uncharacterized protein